MAERREDAGRAFHYLVADALEALVPQVDEWAEDVRGRTFGQRPLGYGEGYEAGVARMAAEVKDQLVARILALRQG